MTATTAPATDVIAFAHQAAALVMAAEPADRLAAWNMAYDGLSVSALPEFMAELGRLNDQ